MSILENLEQIILNLNLLANDVWKLILFETPMMSGLPEKAYQALVDSTLFPKRLGYPKEFAKLVLSIFENNMLNGEVIMLEGSLRMAPK